jgi:exonuclease VII small subunit
MLEKVVTRIEELTKALEQSAAQHNALLGAMQEAKNLYQMLMTEEPKIEDVIDSVEQVAEVVEAL